jgi:hypothetical protein
MRRYPLLSTTIHWPAVKHDVMRDILIEMFTKDPWLPCMLYEELVEMEIRLIIDDNYEI